MFVLPKGFRPLTSADAAPSVPVPVALVPTPIAGFTGHSPDGSVGSTCVSASSDAPRGLWWLDPKPGVEPSLLARLDAAQLQTAPTSTDRIVWSVELTFKEENQESTFTYQPGDAIGLWPQNNPEHVTSLIKQMALNPQQAVCIESSGPTASVSDLAGRHTAVSLDSFQWPQTIESLLLNVYDINGGLSKQSISLLADHCTLPKEAAKVHALAAKVKSATRPSKHRLQKLVSQFPSLQLSLALVFEVLPKMQPRYYSISSSPLSLPGSMMIAFTVVENGLCTQWLHQMCVALRKGDTQQSTQLPFLLKPATHFVLPADTRRPIVMVGPGTGVAPFVGFLDHIANRQLLDSQLKAKGSCSLSAITEGCWGSLDLGEFGLEELHDSSPEEDEFSSSKGDRSPDKSILRSFPSMESLEEHHCEVVLTDTLLFSGFRNREIDYLFQAELEGHVEQKTLGELHLAFSRDQAEKVYVQHKMAEQGETICDLLLEREGYLFVCGDGANMAKDVKEAVLQIFVDHGELTAKEARAAVKQMTNECRFVLDVWST